MTKSSKEQIQLDEKSIIRELQKNSKESIDEIAKKCGFSRQKVWRIIKRLEKNKKIWTYHAVVDEEKLGMKKFLILLKRTNKPLPMEKLEIAIKGDLKQDLANIGVEINDTYYVHGNYDFVLSATTGDVRQMKLLCETLNNVFKDYISDIQVLEVIFPLHKCGCDNPNLEELRKFFLPQSGLLD